LMCSTLIFWNSSSEFNSREALGFMNDESV
jgi:hypothetical protein